MNDRLSTERDLGQDILACLRWPILVVGDDLNVYASNPAFLDCFHLGDRPIEGVGIYELGNSGWDIPELRSLFEEMLPASGQIRDYEIRSTFGTPQERIMVLDAERTGGELPLTVITFRDVSETVEMMAVRKQKQKETLLAEIVDQAPDGVFVVDSQLAMYQVNAIAKPVFANIVPLIGRDLSEVMQTLWGVEVGEIILRAFRNTLQTGERYICSDFSAQRADLGVVQSFDWEIQRICLPGESLGVVCYFTEVTETNAERAMLVTRAEELKRANHNKDEFLAMLAHELRNPLASLSNASEILGMANATVQERSEAQAIICRQLDSMRRLVDDLLDIARITQRKIHLRKTVIGLESILSPAIHLARSVCKEKGQELSLSIQAEDLYLRGDVTRLEQVVGNLLSNASRYSGNGSRICLSVKRSEGPRGSEAVIRVSDNGLGIEPELLPRIFDPFVQSDRTIDRAGGGLGIGLTLAKRLVELHEGYIEAFSGGLNQGTEFVVHLPILPAEHLGSVEHSASERVGNAGCRILIIDDNADSARTLAVIQARKGHETRTAFDGETAIACVAEFLPEVVVIDIGLPGMDGFEVAQRIREFPEMADAFLVAMSGYGGEDFIQKSRGSGFDEYLIKPLDLKQLSRLIQSRLMKE